ncbi:hypothetical protein B0H13DRAFT_1918311 [Mycena leptocephala]|nr:hypothetical protein B0H13DRAFT_1918311 [Mycena leptocephala]
MSDHLLTLDMEVHYVWKTWRTRPSAWFLLIRYSSFAIRTMALVTFDFGNFDPEVIHIDSGRRRSRTTASGSSLTEYGQIVLMVFQELFVGITLVLRVLAMYSFDKRLVIGLGIAVIFCLSFALKSQWCMVPSGAPVTLKPATPGCITPSLSVHHIDFITIFTHTRQAKSLAGDVLLLALTLYQAYTHRRDAPSGSLWRVLIISCLAEFTVALSVTMICRLMLNLHEAAAITSDLSQPTTSIWFAPIQECSGADSYDSTSF